MRRAIARRSEWWLRLFVLSIVVAVLLRLPLWVEIAVWVVFLGLSYVRAPWDRDQEPRWVAAPVRGRWVPVNSPATKVPSHGVRLYGQTYAIDILHPRPPGTSFQLRWSDGMRRPEEFSTFGEQVHAVAEGTVVRVADGARDHRSRESWPAVAYLMFVEAFVRLLAGARAVAGNHVVVAHGDGTFAAYVHLQRGSPAVSLGERVSTGQLIGLVGNSGNTTEPHLHFQLTDDHRLTGSAGVPFRWGGVTIEPGDVDSSWSKHPVATEIIEGLPGDGQVFTAEAAAVRPSSH